MEDNALAWNVFVRAPPTMLNIEKKTTNDIIFLNKIHTQTTQTETGFGWTRSHANTKNQKMISRCSISLTRPETESAHGLSMEMYQLYLLLLFSFSTCSHCSFSLYLTCSPGFCFLLDAFWCVVCVRRKLHSLEPKWLQFMANAVRG